MARQHRSHSVAFKRQVAEEFLAGETLHGLAKRHDLCRNLIRVWVAKYEAGAFDEDARAADLIQAYEARIAALERLVGKQALELELNALLVRAALADAPLRNSSSRACLPTSRSSAAIRASCAWIRSAAPASSSKAPVSYFATQTRIRLRQRSCRFARPCRVSPARNSSQTWRLNATLWDRCCLAMGLLPKTRHPGQFPRPDLSSSGAHSTAGSLFHADPHPMGRQFNPG